MSSILNNPAALSALQSLQMTQQALNTVQNQVSTGLKVATAADNSSYWSIAAQLTADSGVVSASNDALSQGQSVLATASSAINSVITTINSIQTALTQATEPGANIGNINTSLASLGKQLTDAVNAASFNGLNVLNGTVTALNFVSGYNASATGGSINTISFTTQALYGLATGTTSTSSTSQSTVTDAATMSQLQTQFAADTADTTAVSYSAPTATYGNNAVFEDTTNQALTVQSMGLNGTVTTTTYTALDANGNSIAQGGSPTFAAASSYAVTTTTTTPNSQNLLVQSGVDLTNLERYGRRECANCPKRRRPGFGPGHQLRGADRRHPEPHDNGEHVQHRLDDQLFRRHFGHGRCEHEHCVDPIAGASDAGAARHPVAVDRQPERAADPETVPVKTARPGGPSKPSRPRAQDESVVPVSPRAACPSPARLLLLQNGARGSHLQGGRPPVGQASVNRKKGAPQGGPFDLSQKAGPIRSAAVYFSMQ